MSDKIIRGFNDIKYSDSEVQRYIDLAEVDEERYKKISGSVRTRYAIDGLKKTSDMIVSELHSGEYINQIIKVRNIDYINAITVASSVGGTIGGSLDYGIFNTLYFTNERIFFPIQNVANQPLTMKYRDLKDILLIEFGDKEVRVKENDDGTISVKRRISFVYMGAILLELAFLANVCFHKFFGNTLQQVEGMIFGIIVLGIYLAARTYQYFSIDRIQIIFKDGYRLNYLIASENYKECIKYLKKMMKAINREQKQ
ncbi:MAG: hypothetical protein PUE01_05435 [Clostridiaceae bacterium]|nr:hypothetical protein [Clostridiaceae bacterium]